jgi:amino acid adenylation domain-containing protein
MSLRQSIHAVFSAVAARSPERIAIIGDGEPVRYAELEQRSEHIANYLRARGIRPGTRIGLYAQRSGDSIAAMIGILKAGAAYVPFDPSYPPKLLKFIYHDCAPVLLLAQKSLLDQSAEARFWDGEAIDIRGDFDDAAPHATTFAAVDRDAPAYIMYTSGSTGHPKGVLVPHRAVVRLVIENPFALMGPEQVHLQLAPLAFDASTFEIWGALLHGGTLAILPDPHPSLDDIANAIERHGVTTLWLTAGLFHLMVEHRLDGLKPLRQLLAGGDVLSPVHVAKALQALPDCQLINGYGPTENTTFTCCYRIPRGIDISGPVPIGQAIAHTQVYVLDESGKAVVDGEEGELYAGGEGVALGYLNRPELTAERFVVDPFHGAGRGLMYRTGDRVRRRADGNFEFLGRVDRQVKISGKRVELDEIEACIRRCGLVDDAAVVCPEVRTGARKIYAYVKSTRDPEGLIQDLRATLRQELPEYMVPASIVVLEALPLTPTGKVDRTRLSPPASFDSRSSHAPQGPGGAIEATLMKIWCDSLGRESVGLDDNFFDLGGTSLQLIEVHATIRAIMRADVNIVDLFQYPRISALAAVLLHRDAPTQAAPSSRISSARDRARRQQAAIARARSTASRHP